MRLSIRVLIHEQKIQIETQIIQIKEFIAKVKKRVKNIYGINSRENCVAI